MVDRRGASARELFETEASLVGRSVASSWTRHRGMAHRAPRLRQREVQRLRLLLHLLPASVHRGRRGRHPLPGRHGLLQGLRHMRQGMPQGRDNHGARRPTTRRSVTLSREAWTPRTTGASRGRRKVITGNGAAAYAAMLCRPEVVAAYPITPQSEVIEQLAKFHADGVLDCEYVTVEGENSARTWSARPPWPAGGSLPPLRPTAWSTCTTPCSRPPATGPRWS